MVAYIISKSLPYLMSTNIWRVLAHSLAASPPDTPNWALVMLSTAVVNYKASGYQTSAAG